MTETPVEPVPEPVPAPEAPDPDLAENARSIANMLDAILERVVAGFERAGVALPERRYWRTGTPPVDCEQLVVTFRQAYYGPPGDEAATPQVCDGPRSAVVEVRISRCVPTPKGTRATPPSGDEIQQASKAQVIDAWLLLDFAPDLESWNGMSPGGLGVIGTVDAGEAQGAYQTTVLTLNMAIP